MDVSLEGLVTLDAIDRAGTFAGAAVTLHKAQSAVSYAVRQLEQGLGVVLFDRSGRKAVLTPAGRAILEEGRAVLAAVGRLSWTAHRLADGWEADLLVVVDGVLPLAPVVEALQALGQQEVPTRVRVEQGFGRSVQRRFERDAADLMVVRALTPSPDLVAVPLPEEEVVLVAAAAHPVHEAVRSATDLRRFLEVTVHDGAEHGVGAEPHELGGDRSFHLADYHGARQALRMGLGFAWMPWRLVQDDLARGALREVRYAGGSRRRFTPWMARRADRPLGLAGALLASLITSAWPPTGQA